MKYISSLVLVLCMIVLTGCPGLTQNSIDNGSCEIPTWMPGKWIEYTKDGKKKTGYVLEQTNKKSMLNCYESDTSGKLKKGDLMPVTLSNIGGAMYLNVYTKDDGNGKAGYYLIKLRKVSNTEFTLKGVKEHELDYKASQTEIQKFLTSNKDNDHIFDEGETTYRKVK